MTDDAPTDAAPKARGRPFEPGNKFGKGNPLAKRQAAYRQAFEGAVSADDMAEVARAVVTCARDGDMVAARLVCEYLIGKPQPQHDEDDDEGDKPRGTFEVRFVPATPG